MKTFKTFVALMGIVAILGLNSCTETSLDDESQFVDKTKIIRPGNNNG